LASIAPVAPPSTIRSTRITLAGHVQGVGFRPFVYRIARQHGLTGQVRNQVGEVEIIVSGAADAIDRFRADLLNRAPPLSRPVLLADEPVNAPPCSDFTIADSSADAEARIFVPPDYYLCDDCRAELSDPDDRRYRYPFINCTQCGPRYTLIAKLPYDRPNTGMAGFPLCDACRAEYEDPANRRFHAEPVACPTCGPQLTFTTSDGVRQCDGEAALRAALGALRDGSIVAVKGIGGYHLMCDAGNEAAVGRLRQRKHRPGKPLAVMFPLAGDDGLALVGKAVTLTAAETRALLDPARPIVLARKKNLSGLAGNLAPGVPDLGVFLPYTPLHQLLLADFAAPLVATSGNLSGEPVLTDNEEAGRRLAGIADAFLHHDRPILRPADDPVHRSLAGQVRPLRIGRGTAPKEVPLPWRLPEPVLAVGGHMKGTVAIGWEDRAVVSPHIGEMDTPRSMAVFEAVVRDLQRLYGVEARRVVADAHSGYATHRWARDVSGLPFVIVGHHAAHASALVAEHPGTENWLVFTWDGVGLGEDGTLWGGEALFGGAGQWQRVASMRPFRLPGGDRAGREPWRSAAALHWECGRLWPACPDQDGLAFGAWQRGMNAPRTSAAGRLFDAASALVCGSHCVTFEAEGPMLLEALCDGEGEIVPLPLARDAQGILRSDWEPLLGMLADERRTVAARAEAFHSSMAAALVAQATRLAVDYAIERVGLTGGVFQNRALTEQVVTLLRARDLPVFLPVTLPCNDAGISFGQLAEHAAQTGYAETA